MATAHHVTRASFVLIIMAMIGLMATVVAAQPPDQRDVVQAVYNRGGWNLATKQGNGEFTESVLVALRDNDPQWCHLRKTGSQNQWNGHAVDAVLYRSLGWSVDVIRHSESANAAPAWTPDSRARYTPASCVPDVGTPVPIPGTPPLDLSVVLEKLAELEQRVISLDIHLNVMSDEHLVLQTEIETVADLQTILEKKIDDAHHHHVADEQAANHPWWVDSLKYLPAVITGILAAIGAAR